MPFFSDDDAQTPDTVVGMTFRREGDQPVVLARPQTSPTVLLVEDSGVAADAIGMLLRSAGARVRRADSIQAADRHLRSFAPEAVIIDPGLPDGNGLKLVRRLWLMGANRPRLIVVSGDEDAEETAQVAGADRFFAKPLTAAALLREILTESGVSTATVALPAPVVATLIADLQGARLLVLQAALSGRADQMVYPMQFLSSLAQSSGLHELEYALQQQRNGCETPRDLALTLARMIGAQVDLAAAARASF